jgi:hypothetical protein
MATYIEFLRRRRRRYFLEPHDVALPHQGGFQFITTDEHAVVAKPGHGR